MIVSNHFHESTVELKQATPFKHPSDIAFYYQYGRHNLADDSRVHYG